MAAVAMRRVLVDHARQRDAAKRGLGVPKVPYDAELHDVPGPMPDDRLLALDTALTRLDGIDPRQARVVELRFFAGLSVQETATALGIANVTVKREWAAARAWLYDALEGQGLDGA
jgi:RNA polymerase sigma factor (TIGR02999 family)